MEKELLQNRILELIGEVVISEEVLEQTITKLRHPDFPKQYAQKLAESTTKDEISDSLFLKKAREKKYFSICYLTHQLLTTYTTDAIPCFILHQYFLALRCDQEKNLDWYKMRINKAFPVNPTLELRTAETKVLKYLKNEPLNSQHLIRYRHFWCTLFLFFDYITNYDAVEELLNKFSSSAISLRLNY